MIGFYSKKHTYEKKAEGAVVKDVFVNKTAFLFFLSLFVPFAVNGTISVFGGGLALVAVLFASSALVYSVVSSSENFVVRFVQVLVVIATLVSISMR